MLLAGKYLLAVILISGWIIVTYITGPCHEQVHSPQILSDYDVRVKPQELVHVETKPEIDTLCSRHKAIMAQILTNKENPEDYLHAMSCERLYRGVSDFVKDIHQVYRLTQALDRNYVNIKVVGGSVSKGSMDFFRVGDQLRWSSRLAHMLQRTWSSVELDNISKGGRDVRGHSRHVAEYTSSNTSIYLLEFSINDQFLDSGTIEEKSNEVYSVLLNQPKKPAVVAIELFRSGWQYEFAAKKYNASWDAMKHCGGKVRTFEDQNISFCDEWWTTASSRIPARRNYHVPAISYRDAVFPNLESPPDDLFQMWNGFSHPGPKVHFWIAESIAFAFLFLKSGLETNKDSGNAICLTPNEVIPSSISCGWFYGEDVPGKPGWIFEKGFCTSPLLYTIKVGNQGIVRVEYLVSYDHKMGSCDLLVNGILVTTLNSNIELPVSVPEAYIFNSKQPFLTVEFKMKMGSKFKILSVSTC